MLEVQYVDKGRKCKLILQLEWKQSLLLFQVQLVMTPHSLNGILVWTGVFSDRTIKAVYTESLRKI